jgi:hypothetical protein
MHVNWFLLGNYASKTWAVVGPLIGVLVGGYLTGHVQRRQWIAANKKEEYRELLSKFNECSHELLLAHTEQRLTKGEKNKQMLKLLTVLENRIFISDAIGKINPSKRWTDGIVDLEKGKAIEFAKVTGDLSEEIRLLARVDIASALEGSRLWPFGKDERH